jgi:hypothetical protein
MFCHLVLIKILEVDTYFIILIVLHVNLQSLQLDRVSRTEKLQKALLEYLALGSDNDASLVVSLSRTYRV